MRSFLADVTWTFTSTPGRKLYKVLGPKAEHTLRRRVSYYKWGKLA